MSLDSQSTLALVKGQRDVINQQVNDLNSQIQTYTNAIQAYPNQSGIYNGRISSLEQQLGPLQMQLDTLNAQISELQTNNQSMSQPQAVPIRILGAPQFVSSTQTSNNDVLAGTNILSSISSTFSSIPKQWLILGGIGILALVLIKKV